MRAIWLLVLLAALPLTLALHLLVDALAALARGHLPTARLFVKHPTASASNHLAGPPEAAARQVAERMQALGFHADVAPAPENDSPEGTWDAQGAEGTAATQDVGAAPAVHVRAAKAATPHGQSFLDAAFEAKVRAAGSDGDAGERTRVEATVTQLTTLILDTGESQRLRGLAEYFCLRSDRFEAPVVPFLAYWGATLAWGAVLGAALMRPHAWWQQTAVVASSFTGTALCVVALVQAWRRPAELFGVPLALASVAAALMPYAVRLIVAPPRLRRMPSGYAEVVLLAALVLATMIAGELRYRRRAAAAPPGAAPSPLLHRLRWFGSAFALFLLGMAALIALEAATAGEARPIHARELEAGTPPPSRWLRVRGFFDLERGRWLKSGTLENHYVPLVSRPGRNPVAVLLLLDDAELQELLRDDEGFLYGEYAGWSQSGAPDNNVRRGLQEHGTELADGCIVLEYRLTPRDLAKRALPALWLGAGVLLVIVLGHLAARLFRAPPAADGPTEAAADARLNTSRS